jgi:hypothetical protein
MAGHPGQVSWLDSPRSPRVAAGKATSM